MKTRPPIIRPENLREVAAHARGWDLVFFHDMLNEFLDEFYMDERPASRQARLDAAPDFTGRTVIDAWLCAAGEHLALRWGLRVPDWIANEAGFRLTKPDYGGADDMPRLRKVLEQESPPPFRRRNIFVEEEPLRRARFPNANQCRATWKAVPEVG